MSQAGLKLLLNILPHVLVLMRKAPFDLFRKLKNDFDSITERKWSEI